jgi:Flp pilus assembly pilin Flp
MKSGMLSERGSVSVEYAVLVTVVALVCAGAVAMAGRRLVLVYLEAELWLALPLP